MNAQNTATDLGFAEVNVPPGSHACQIFTDTDERNESLLKFLLKGLECKERSACFSDDEFYTYFTDHFPEDASSREECIGTGKIVLNNAEMYYFKNNRFDPDLMLKMLAEFHDKSIDEGFSGARIIGEMHPRILSVAGGERLLEYETRVNSLLVEHPVTAVCQYNANEFSGGFIMDVLKSHPMMIVRGMVVHNPYFETMPSNRKH